MSPDASIGRMPELGGRGELDFPLRFATTSRSGVALGGGGFQRLVSMQGQESLSQPFELSLDVRSDDASQEVGFEDLLGQPIVVGAFDRHSHYPPVPDPLITADGAGCDGHARPAGARVWHGIVAGVAMAEPGVYQLTVRPTLWKLSLANHYRVLSRVSVRDAIAQVLDGHAVRYDMSRLDADPGNIALTRVQDYLQAGESDLDFVQHLLTKANLFYYFDHGRDVDTVVFSNRAIYPAARLPGRPLRYTYTNIEALGLEEQDVLAVYNYAQQLTSSGVKAVFTRQQDASDSDAVARYTSFESPEGGDPGARPFNLYRIYQYGLSRDEVRKHEDHQRAMLATSATTLSGASRCPDLRVGYTFELAGQVRPSLNNQTFVVTSLKFEASLDGTYKNELQATEHTGLITPFSLQDTHQGSVLARVETHGAPSDYRYYEPSDFDPQPNRQTDADASPPEQTSQGVYVTLSSDPTGEPVWVKLAPHMQTAPEAGALVLVSRSSDACELPEVQSIVQANGAFTVTPSRWTANTSVGSSYNTAYGDGKSIRFGRRSQPDLKRAKDIVEAAYDSEQYREVSYSQGGSYNYATSDAQRAGLLSRSVSYGNTYAYQEGAQSESESKIDRVSNKSEHIEQTNQSSVKVLMDASEVGSQVSTRTVGTENSTSSVGSQTQTSKVGTSQSVSLAGAQVITSLTGAAQHQNVTGVSSQINVTGVQHSVNVAGTAASLHVTGATSDISIKGAGMTVDIMGGGLRADMHGTVLSYSTKQMEAKMVLTIAVFL